MSDHKSASKEALAEDKKSTGQLFKEKHGYSRTMAKLMRKYECSNPDQYRKIRRERRKK